MATARPVSADDWTAAALTALRAEGPSAVRVEAIARGLGVSKGSFYWHFCDRKALLERAIERWEAESTAAVIAESERGASPADKLRRLLDVVGRTLDHPVPPGELMLYLQAEAEGVQPSVERVVARRLDYVCGLLVELGIDRAEAQRRAALAVTLTVGFYQLNLGAPRAMSRRALSRKALAETIYAALTH